MKISRNEQGIAHMLVILVVGAVLITGAVGYRVISSNKAKQNKAADTTASDQAEKVSIDTENLDQVDGEVDVPSGEQEVSKPSSETPPSNQSGSPQTIQFTKGGAGMDGDHVIASATTSGTLDGKCYFTFKLNDSVVNFSNKAAGKECWILGHISSFPKNGTWTMSMNYVSNDGKTTGSVGGYSVVINPKPRTINFTKGGASQSASGTVSASSTLSETVSGTCTFTFSLNGTVRVEKTTNITNSNKCEHSSITGFPKSAEYQYTLSFKSNDSLINATQGAFGVTVNY